MNAVLQSLERHIVGLAHVGFVVPDLDQAVAAHCRLYGSPLADVRFEGDPAFCRFAFLPPVAGIAFEFIHPVQDAMRTTLTQSASGPAGINHLAWQVDDLDRALVLLAQQGVFPGYVTPDGPAQLSDKRIVYLNPDQCGGALVELIAWD